MTMTDSLTGPTPEIASSPGGSVGGGGDSNLDAEGTDDRTYLGQLGYKQELRRSLGFFSSFAVQWTAIAIAGGLALSLGAGLNQVGPLVLFAWLIAGGLQMFVGVSVAEGVSAYPLAGGSYQIINRILGGRNPIGWQVGWWLIAAHIAAFATEAYGIAPFIMSWFGITITSHGAILLWSTVLIVLSTVINLVAVRVAAAFNNTVGVAAEFLAIGIIVIGVLISLITGHSHFHSLSYLTSSHGVVPHGTSAFWPFLFAMLVPVFVISGFDINGTAGEETEDAARNVPRALLICNFSTFVIGTIIILFTVLSITDLAGTNASADTIRFVMSSTLGSGIAKVFEICAVVSLFVNMMILQLTAARVLWSQARDGQMPFPRLLLRLSKDHVPYVTVIIAAVIGFLFIVYSGLLTVLLSMTAILWAAGYAVVVAVLMYAKARGLLPHRPFTTGRWWPLIDTVAVVWSVAICVILIKSNPKDVGWGFVGTIVVGLIIYFGLIPRSRRGVLKDVRSDAEIHEHEVGA
jgi:amino acid transporter